MAENLEPVQRLEYLNFGHTFMPSLNNVQSSVFLYSLLHSSNVRTLIGKGDEEPLRKDPRPK